MDISVWLQDLGLEQYASAFRDNDIDADTLSRLTAEDLIALGVTSVGHRRKFLTAVQALRHKPTSVLPIVPPAAAETASPRAERRQLTVMSGVGEESTK